MERKTAVTRKLDKRSNNITYCFRTGVRPEELKEKGLTVKNSDWLQGYGYQMWRCRHDAIRADGANGQYIIILPEKDAVIVTTAHIGDMQAEINLIWKYILPALP